MNDTPSQHPATPVLARAMVALAIAIVALFTALSRNDVWNTESSLWLDTAMKSPGKARVMNALGSTSYYAGKPELALLAYRTAIQLSPEYADAHVGLGVVLASRGNLNEALEQYGIALDLKPDDAVLHYHLGLLYMEDAMRDLPRAREEFRTAISLKPTYGAAIQFLSYAEHMK